MIIRQDLIKISKTIYKSFCSFLYLSSDVYFNIWGCKTTQQSTPSSVKDTKYKINAILKFRFQNGQDQRIETQRKRVSAQQVYIDFYRWSHRQTRSIGIPVGDSAGDCATSLYEDPGLNPSVIPSVKSPKNPRHHTVATFQKNYIFRRDTVGIYQRKPIDVFRQYIPIVSPTGIFCRYIPTKVVMELFLLVIFTNEKIPSVISLVFADFLVVVACHGSV